MTIGAASNIYLSSPACHAFIAWSSGMQVARLQSMVEQHTRNLVAHGAHVAYAREPLPLQGVRNM